MTIWVDADACPKPIKEILFRAARRLEIKTILVANRPLRVPASEFIDTILVPGGYNVADAHIEEQVKKGDLVITADIPLAAAVIDRGATVLEPRGRLLTKDNVGEALSIRNFMDEVRSTGVVTGGPSTFSNRDKSEFANMLNRYLESGSE